MKRRTFLQSTAAFLLTASCPGRASTTDTGQRLVQAARAQIGVTLGYDPGYTHLSYPGGDVPRLTGVCADVVIRAGRDALGLDLQKLVHEDMLRNFDAYPAHKAWGTHAPDASIDHRRVLNLETYWQRSGAQLSMARSSSPGDVFPNPIRVGDIVTWRLDGRLPHVGIVSASGAAQASVIHNVGNGVEETILAAFHSHAAAGHYRWPVS